MVSMTSSLNNSSSEVELNANQAPLSFSPSFSPSFCLSHLLPTVRCPHHCRSNTSCKQFSRCILVLSEPGLETTTGPVRSHVTVATAAVSTAAQSSSSVLNPEEEPRSGHAHLKPERGVSLSKQVRRRANEVSRLLSRTGSSEEVQETAGPHRPGSRSTSESRSGPHPGMAEKKKQPLR